MPDWTMDGSGAYGNPFGVGGFGLPDIMNDPGYRRQAAFQALTDAGLGLINASAPSPYPKDIGTTFGALAGGAAQGAKDAQQSYMQRAMYGAQLRNLQMQSAMYPAALNALQQGGGYDPYGNGQSQGQPTDQTASAPSQDSSQPNPNNIGNVRPTGASTGFQQPADFNSGVKLAVNTARAYPAAFNNGQPMTLIQIGQRWAPQGDGNNDPSQWARNVSAISGLPVDKPLDLNDPATATAFARGVHGAEWGGNAVRPVADYSTALSSPGGVQLAQAGSGQPGGMAPFPMNPPDPSKYQALTMLGGQWAEIGKQRYQADLQRYNAAKSLWEAQMKARGQNVTEQNADVLPNGQPNPAKLAAKKAEKQGEMEATEEARKKAIYGGPNWADMSPDEVRKKANPELIKLVDDVQSGRTRLADVSGRQASSGISIGKNDVLAMGSKLYGDNWNPNAGDIRYEWEKDAADSNKPGSGATIYAINTVFQHLDQYQDLIKAIKNGDTPTFNRINEWFHNQTGSPLYTNAEALRHALGTEMARVIKGGQLNESDVDAAVSGLDATQSPEQMMGHLNVMRHAMQARINTITEQGLAHYVPEGRLKSIIMTPSGRKAVEHFDKGQQEFADNQAKTQQAQGNLPPGADPTKYDYRFDSSRGVWQRRPK